jgi:hypothetical protein
MEMLSREAQARARAFIFEHGRPLERAKFRYHFEGGRAEGVFDALVPFQNADGGFGHGLEADLRTKSSSALATTVALQHLREYGAGADHPLVQGAIRCLLATYDAEGEVWPIIPPTANDAPHAPWWLLDEGITERFGDYLANPRAEIVGYLYDYAGLVPVTLRERLTDAVVEHLRARGDALNGEEIPCTLRLIRTETLPAGLRSELVSLLAPVVNRVVVRDPAQWGSYGLTPLEIVEGPDSPFAALLGDVVPAYLDYEIAQHAEDGVWQPKWTWYGLYPEAWPQAKQDWSGYITVRMLTILKRFGRLEA